MKSVSANRAVGRALLLALLGACSGTRATGDVEPVAPRGTSNIVTAAEIGQFPTGATIEEILAHHVPGVHLQRSRDGRMSLQIGRLSSTRGRNEPLFVIDGVPLRNLSGSVGINPRDVERVEVLKDAATSLYGIRGANGVIVITTRQQE